MKKKIKTEPLPEKKRQHLIPKDYLSAVADRIHSINPTKEIVQNTLRDVWCEGYAQGYLARISDNKYFKEKRELRIKESFDSVYTSITDEIHGGIVQKKELQNENNN